MLCEFGVTLGTGTIGVQISGRHPRIQTKNRIDVVTI